MESSLNFKSLNDHNVSLFKYREQQISWVSGLEGTTFMDVLWCFIPFIIGYGCFLHFLNFVGKRKFKISQEMYFLIEFIWLVLPLLVSLTFTKLRVPIACFFFGYFMLCQLKRHLIQQKSSFNSDVSTTTTTTTWKQLESDQKRYLTAYRSCTMISTCIAILGVDFPIFPRRLAKTELIGVSVMDLGVGSFLFSSSLISGKYLLGKSKSLKHSLMSVLPMFTLGLIRFLLVKLMKYQEHVTEYGLHWNFYFTMSFLSLLLNVCQRLGWFQYSAMYGVLLLVIYEIALHKFGLTDYILYHPRTDWLSQNREGIFSLVGYLSLCLIGRHIGSLLFMTRTWEDWKKFHRKLISWTLGSWILVNLGIYGGFVISRRLTNIMYILWVIACSLFFVSTLMLMDMSSSHSKLFSQLLDSVNHYQLAIFLLANILTGCVNQTMYTLYTSDSIAFSILCVYVFLLCLVAHLLYRYKIDLKFI